MYANLDNTINHALYQYNPMIDLQVRNASAWENHKIQLATTSKYHPAKDKSRRRILHITCINVPIHIQVCYIPLST